MNEELKQLRRQVDTKLIQRETARERRSMAISELDQAKSTEISIREAVALAQGVATIIQEQAHKKIANIVSRSLEAVFDEPYEFKIIFEQKRGRTEASLVFTRDGMDIDPMSASGGGVVDVAALALRLSCLLLARPPLRRLLVLDEPLKFLSVEYRPRAKRLIETLSKELNVQFLIVTHLAELRCGKVVEL